MDINERREKILEILNEQGQVKVNGLSREFGISNITIRSDLADMTGKRSLPLRMTKPLALALQFWQVLQQEFLKALKRLAIWLFLLKKFTNL